ncbi:hypothetical protein K6025_01990 [Ehrlichia sp. JZT12]
MLNYKNTGGKLYKSLLSSLKNFNFANIRNINQVECTDGRQFWEDMHRCTLLINEHKANFPEEKDKYVAEHSIPIDNELHKASSQILSTLIKKYSGYNINQELINECITILHQGSIHGAVYTGITHSFGAFFKEAIEIDPEADIAPITRERITKLKVISPKKLSVSHEETTDYIETLEGSTITSVKSSLKMDITKVNACTIMYHDIVISLHIPRNIAHLFVAEQKTTSCNIADILQQLHSYVTNSAHKTATEIQTTEQEDGTLKLKYELSNIYQCSSIRLKDTPEMQDAALYNSMLVQAQVNNYQEVSR